MAKSYITLDTRIDSFKDEFNNLVNKVGDIAVMSTSGTDSDVVGGINNLDSDVGVRANLTTAADQNLVVAINEHDAELGTITAGAMGTTASTVSTAVLELDTEADSDRANLAANVKKLMLDDGVSKEITSTANNSTNESTFLTFVDGATGAQGIETDTGLTYNPSSGLITATSLAAATLDISGNVDIDGTSNLDAVDIDGAVQVDATVTVGVDDTGYDVKFFGDAASAFMQWDASADDLILGGAAGLIVPDGQLTLGSTALTSTATELNLLDNVSGLVQADFTKLAAVNSTAAEINLLNSVSGLVQADFTKLAAVNSTAAELNILDGSATSATSTTIVDADRVIVNDNGTMVQVAVTDLAAYFDDEITAMPNLVTTGALNSGSITSGFGAIDIGSSTITTTGIITGGGLTVGSAALLEAELEILDGANVTTAELNIMDGGTSGSSITVVDADRFVMNDGGVMKQVNASFLKTYFGTVTGGTAITTLDIDGATDINAAIVDADLFIVDDGAGGTNRKTTASRLLTYTNAGLSTRAAQTNITSLGTLSALQVDNVNINGNTISSTAGTDLNITPLSGQQIVLDGTIAVDAGVITGATSITSTAFVGTLTGNITGTAPVATKATLVATNSTNASHFLTFTDTATGDENIRTDTGLTYNPSTNTITASTFDGAVTGGITGNAATATTLATTRAISITGDVTASGVNFNGSAAIALNTSIANNAVVTATINADAVTGAKIADNAINSEHYTDGSIDRAHLAADIVDGTKIADDVINSEHYVNASVDFAHIQNVTGNSILVRNASSSGVISSVAVADTKILIGDGTGFGAFGLSGDVTMTNAGVTNIGADKVGSPELNTLRTFTLKDSSGSTLFTMFGAGA